MGLANWTPKQNLDRIFKRMHPLTSRRDDEGPGPEILSAIVRSLMPRAITPLRSTS
jgi:hypothetical protein